MFWLIARAHSPTGTELVIVATPAGAPSLDVSVRFDGSTASTPLGTLSAYDTVFAVPALQLLRDCYGLTNEP